MPERSRRMYIRRKGNRYTVRFLGMLFFCLFFLASCGKKEEKTENWAGLQLTFTEENQYAEEFVIEQYEGGFRRITIKGTDYLVVPNGKEIPEQLPKDVTVIRQPAEKIYMASSSAMSFFQELGSLSRVGYTSTGAGDWSDTEIAGLVRDDTITFVGKYNAPDYEWLLQEGCGLIVENTMILHDPGTKEKLEQLGFPVMIERSSYEKHPMGRMEWIRVYGCILGMEEKAEHWFQEKNSAYQDLIGKKKGREQRVAYFSFSPNGYVNIQAPSGYMAEMIRIAGGTYAFTAADLGVDPEDSSSLHLSTEQFYAVAKDADILIYNGAIYGAYESITAMVKEKPLMKEFSAVKSGKVYYTKDNLFQKPTGVTELLEELTRILSEEEGKDMKYLIRMAE